jgi:hypothetical protein
MPGDLPKQVVLMLIGEPQASSVHAFCISYGYQATPTHINNKIYLNKSIEHDCNSVVYVK